ncbi:MAG: hypothetical protein LBL73_05110 [Synergistaceae bacterium]|nr:hypothetical protein [Synergistaceae bacterium]
MPGEEASLDVYQDRPIVGGNPPRYAGIEISPAILDASGKEAIYIKITMYKDYGTENVQKKLAAASDGKLFESFPARGSDPPTYKSGLDLVERIK